MKKEESLALLKKCLDEIKSLTPEQYAQRLKDLGIKESDINLDDYVEYTPKEYTDNY